MNRKILVSIAVLILATMACSSVSLGSNSTVVGSGNIVSETRNITGIQGVNLAGSGDVEIKIGTTESVIVRADDNIVPLIETTVSNGRLTIRTKPFTNISTHNGIHVTVVAKSLNELTMGGSGSIRASGVTGPNLVVTLPGSGDITVTGTVDHVGITLLGSGNIYCENLKASSANVQIMGSGNITAYADKSLEASIMGSGTIHYSGSPEQVSKSITGSGSITE
jgi:hypothetical protein